MFIKRLISGIVLLALIALTNYMGGDFLLAYNLLLSLIALYEFNKLIGMEKRGMGLISYASVILYYTTLKFVPSLGLLPLVALLGVLACVYVCLYPKYTPRELTHVVYGVIYAGIMLSFIYQTRMLDSGLYMVWLIFISSWGSDTCAYLTGITIGRIGNHKLTPKLSPKKTVEGFIGGVVGAVVLSLIYAYVIKKEVFLYVVAALLGSLISVVGDLIASAFKRHYEIKDYGKIIPGHGGVLDRYDSVAFTAPFVYYAIVLIRMI